MLTLARADAFGTLKFSRRETLWHVAGLEADELPLFNERTGNIHNAKSFIRNGRSHSFFAQLLAHERHGMIPQRKTEHRIVFSGRRDRNGREPQKARFL